MLPCGHYPAEQVPDETYAELPRFSVSIARMAATPFDAILEKSRDLIEERMAEAVSAMLERAEATLNDLIDKTEDAGFALRALGGA